MLWSDQPMQGNPNNPELSFSEFGQRHRIVGGGHLHQDRGRPACARPSACSSRSAEGNRFAGAGGNRYSFIYSGDVNGDGQGGNDLIYIPRDQSEIVFADCATPLRRNVTPQQQWDAARRVHRAGQLPEPPSRRDRRAVRRGESVVQQRGSADPSGLLVREHRPAHLPAEPRHAQRGEPDQFRLGRAQGGQLLRDLAAHVHRASTAAARPMFNFTGPAETFIDDPGMLSRWRAQIGLRYFFD